ncbi:hypothetical protein Back11_26260 [Paenibacillus baekrokdamisoli]|uniref:Uncharacterized protein n=1 Tax=Paenibacillus baekrokdamisoli TaxID=1712516 RepID=A0A3G9J691_9BACL|nr:hypothetical protein [Paenibacillus baekrokdamisoli]MBB3070276.1 hypothetical protein [Paenibacillus baekrokdamisoli]BBH21281.1 hypothetical protein Back11_26260 [Paenibacillus baekrokdamisoli]
MVRLWCGASEEGFEHLSDFGSKHQGTIDLKHWIDFDAKRQSKVSFEHLSDFGAKHQVKVGYLNCNGGFEHLSDFGAKHHESTNAKTGVRGGIYTMNELFKLLFSNIFIVIAIIGFIISVIRKAQKGSSTTQMPSFGGRPTPNASSSPQYPAEQRSEERPIERPVMTYSSAQTNMESSSSRSEYVEPEYLKELNAKKALAEREQKQHTAHSASNTQERRSESFRMAQGNELRRAVILAEVLGPPRAKQPFRRS